MFYSEFCLLYLGEQVGDTWDNFGMIRVDKSVFHHLPLPPTNSVLITSQHVAGT